MAENDSGRPIVKAEHLRFGYTPGIPVLIDVSFEVHAGEVLMILGANGCGKSTLLRTLLGENKHHGGRVTLGGSDIGSLKPVETARRVAMVFQEHTAPFPFTVMEVVTMGRAPYLPAYGAPTRKDTAICEEALEVVGLSHLRGEAYTLLSGGERQLVLIARALAQQTDLIMMDEPTSHLDYRNAAIVIKTANRLAGDQNKAVIIITHMPDHAFYYPTKAALMRGGRFFAYGPSREVLTDANLSQVYNMEIRVLHSQDPIGGEDHLLCRPVLDSL